MDERTRRIGQNEALHRHVNEEIESLNRGMAAVSDGKLHIVCECGYSTCHDRLTVTVEKYEQVRTDSSLFFVLPGHELPSAEDVVEAGAPYNVVRKHSGEPAALAEATDPR